MQQHPAEGADWLACHSTIKQLGDLITWVCEYGAESNGIVVGAMVLSSLSAGHGLVGGRVARGHNCTNVVSRAALPTPVRA